MQLDLLDENTEPPANRATKIIVVVTCVLTFLIAAMVVAGFVGCARGKPKAKHLLRLPQMHYQAKDEHAADTVQTGLFLTLSSNSDVHRQRQFDPRLWGAKPVDRARLGRLRIRELRHSPPSSIRLVRSALSPVAYKCNASQT